VNGPLMTGSRRQANPRPQPHQEANDVTGGTAAIFHAGTAPRQRHQELIRRSMESVDTSLCLSVGLATVAAGAARGTMAPWSSRSTGCATVHCLSSWREHSARCALLGGLPTASGLCRPGLVSVTSDQARVSYRSYSRHMIPFERYSNM
jgi:hypothetical protein